MSISFRVAERIDLRIALKSSVDGYEVERHSIIWNLLVTRHKQCVLSVNNSVKVLLNAIVAVIVDRVSELEEMNDRSIWQCQNRYRTYLTKRLKYLVHKMNEWIWNALWMSLLFLIRSIFYAFNVKFYLDMYLHIYILLLVGTQNYCFWAYKTPLTFYYEHYL